MIVETEHERWASQLFGIEREAVVCGPVVLDISIVSFEDYPFQFDKEPFFHQDPAYLYYL